MSKPIVTEHPSDMMSRGSSGRFDSSAPPTFQEAFEAAKEQHSQDEPDEQAPPPEVSTDDDEEPDAPPEPKADKAAVAPASTAAKTDTGLMSDEEFSALQTKHANDPIALQKALNTAFTKKSQARAADLKAYEKLKPYEEIVDAFEADADGTLKELAESRGFTLVPKGQAAPPAKAETAATSDEVDTILDEFRTTLGPELDYLAEPLVPAIKALVDRLTKQTVAAEVEPLKAQAKVTQTKAAQEATNAVMKTFDETHPGWKDVEDQMTALGAKIQPNGMDELEYLDMLYQHVTRDGQDQSREQTIEKEVAARLKKAVARLNEGAEDAETPTRSTPDRQVKTAPPPNAGFRDAYAAAKRGERWE